MKTYHNIQRIFKNPLYVNLKKHYCPVCGKQLGKVKVSKIVNSRSAEAKNFDFEFGDGYLIGNVKVIWTEFRCDHCGRHYTIDEMKKIENAKSPVIWRIFLCCVFVVVAVLLLISFTSCYKKKGEADLNKHIAVKYIYNDATPFYVYWKKHTCPACGEKLKVAYESVVVNSDSPEAERYDFEIGDTYVDGDMEFRICFFQCPKCGFRISFKEMKNIEKGNEKNE